VGAKALGAFMGEYAWGETYTGEVPKDSSLGDLTELVKQVRNRCDIYLLLLQGHYCEKSIEPLLPTLLEDMYEDCKEMIDRYCVVHHG